MIVGIGVDLVNVYRMARLHGRYGRRLACKLLSDDEMTIYDRSATQVPLLAKRFAAKEAVAKALGTGMRGGVHFPQISIGNRRSGAPVVTLTGGAKERATRLGVTATHVTITDEREYVVAFAVLEQ